MIKSLEFKNRKYLLENKMKYAKLDNKYKRRSHNIFKEILEKYAKDVNPKILDVGCASGILGKIRQSPNNIFGIEFNEDLAKLAKENCEKVYEINLNSFSAKMIEEKNFDFIFLGDVLEHVLNPEKVLEEVIKLLSENGLIIVSLPNIAQLQFRLKLLLGIFDYTETGVMDKTHLHFYTYKTAINLIKKNNLSIINIYPSGTLISFIKIFPKLIAPQFIFVCKKLKNTY